MTRRALWYGLSVVLAIFALAAFNIAEAGADQPADSWGTFSASYVWGECNLQFQNEGPVTSGEYDGYVMDVACQLAVPAGDTVQVIQDPLPEGSGWWSLSTMGNSVDAESSLSTCLSNGDNWCLDSGADDCENGQNIFWSPNTASYTQESAIACDAPSSDQLAYGPEGGAGDLGVTSSWIASANGSGQTGPVSGYYDVYYHHDDSVVDGYYSEQLREALTVLGTGAGCGGGSAHNGDYCDPSEDIASDGSCSSGYVGPSPDSSDGSLDGNSFQAVNIVDEQQLGSVGIDTITCSSAVGTVQAFPSSYYVGGTASPPAPPCSLESVVGDSSDLPSTDSDEALPYTFDFDGAAQVIVVDPGDGAADTLSIEGQDFSTDSGVDESPASGDTVSVKVASGTLINPSFWCYDAGTWYNWGDASTAPANSDVAGSGTSGTDGGSFDLATCFGSSGMDLYDPVSWVTGALKDGACIMHWLFVPKQSSVDAIESSFGVGVSNVCDGSESATVSQLFGCMTGGLVVGPPEDVATMQAAVNDGSCSSFAAGSTALTVGGTSISACDLVADTANSHFDSTATSTESVLVTVESAAVYIFAALALIFLIRSTLRGAGDS